MFHLYKSYDSTLHAYFYVENVAIPANQTDTTIKVRPINDGNLESDETVTISITEDVRSSGCGCGCSCSCGCGVTGSSYEIDEDAPAATITIKDNDEWDVYVEAPGTVGSEVATGDTADSFTFLFTRFDQTYLTNLLTVYYRLSDTATRGTDYTLSSELITILTITAALRSTRIRPQ